MKNIASVSMSYVADFKSLTEKHELDTGEALTEKVDPVMVNPSDNMLSNRKDDHVDSDMFRLGAMTLVVRVLRYVTKSSAHGRVFCYTAQSSFQYMVLASGSEEVRAVTKDNSRKSGTKREAEASIKLRRVIELNNSALQFIVTLHALSKKQPYSV